MPQHISSWAYPDVPAQCDSIIISKTISCRKKLGNILSTLFFYNFCEIGKVFPVVIKFKINKYEDIVSYYEQILDTQINL